MSNNQRFDDNIKEQFQDYTPQVHPRIWENIVAEREKRKPVGFWLNFFNGRNIFVLTAVLLALSGGAYLLLKKSGSQDDNTTAVNSPKNTTTAGTVAANTNNEKTDTNNPDEGINNTANKNIVVPQTGGAAAGTDNSDKNNNSNGDNTTINKTGAVKIKIHSGAAGSEETEATTTASGKKSNTTTSNDYTVSNADVMNDAQIIKDIYLRRILFEDLQKVSTDKKSPSLSKRNLPNVLLPGCPSIEKDAAANKTYIEIYGGPDIAFRSLTDTGNSAYLQKRKESTKFSSAFSAGIRYTKVFNNGMSIRTGINYSQINEKFTFVQGNLVQITYIIDANGDTTGSYITTGTRYKTTINKFRTVDVPLLIGYELGNGKFHANINAGVIVNVYSWQKGDVLDTSYRPISITTGKTSSPYQFKTNIGVGFMIGTSFYYKLNEKVHLLAEPYYRYSLAPMSKEKLTITQKYNTAGLRIGLRVDLH